MSDTQPVILLVACKPSAHLLLEMFLLSKGLQVFTARSVNSAALQLRALKPDVIILDGCELGDACREIVKRLKRLSFAPVLVFRNAASASCGPAEADGDLAYPVNIADLSAQLAHTLEHWTPGLNKGAGHRG